MIWRLVSHSSRKREERARGRTLNITLTILFSTTGNIHVVRKAFVHNDDNKKRAAKKKKLCDVGCVALHSFGGVEQSHFKGYFAHVSRLAHRFGMGLLHRKA